jgi:kievitone hydratase
MLLSLSERTFTSQATGLTYPLDWVLSLADVTHLANFEVGTDQELHAANGTLPTYEGYITVTGTYEVLRLFLDIELFR